jgi:hypothetical protein
MQNFSSNPERNRIINNNLKIAKYLGFTEDIYDHGINGVKHILNHPNDSGHYVTPAELDYDYNLNSLLVVIDKISTDKPNFKISTSSNGKYFYTTITDGIISVRGAGKYKVSLYNAVLNYVNKITKKDIVKISIEVEIESDKSKKEISYAIKRGIFKGLDSPGFYIASPDKVNINDLKIS